MHMKMAVRAVAIVIRKDEVLLMERNNHGKAYHVFPGGGVEKGETVQEAVVREVKEETTLDIKIEKLLYHHHYLPQGDQYFYLCSYISGEPQLGEGNEKDDMDNNTGNFYKPLWVKISEIKNLLLYPLEIRDWLLQDLQNNFQNTPREATIAVVDLRQSQ